MSSANPVPEIEVYDHTGDDEMSVEWLEGMGKKALPRCIENTGTESPVLPGLETVEVSLISDEEIAKVHDEFMDDPSATDVITFQHGEILISVDTARYAGLEHGNSLKVETLLYLIHGLLHLNGHVDKEEPERSAMHRCQEKILHELMLGDSST